MDIIINKYFNRFIEEMELIKNCEDKNFEKFINYIVLSSKNISNFNLVNVTTGDGGDCAIDGLAIALNNKFINDLTELQDLMDIGMAFSLDLFFIQTKRSEKFDGSEMLQFGNGVCNIFNNIANKVRNKKLEDKIDMINYILENFEFFSETPKCHLMYVTTGKWLSDQNVSSDIDKIISDIKSLNIFGENIYFTPLGNNEIRKLYESTRIQNSATFELKNKIDIPYMDKVKESYLALMPLKEYLNIIVDDENRIRKGIFELNVRDFGGITDNRVNGDIEKTLKSDKKDLFGLLNNGITIVGNSLSKGKDRYTIKNFYIVNGCQTTNVLHQNLAEITSQMWISIKIVITNDDEIIKDIVKATNNQTEVKEIQLQSMEDYQKLLESFYENFDDHYQLYYERRAGQHNHKAGINTSRVISPEIQMRSFASLFLKIPNKASRFYGTLIEEIGSKIFYTGHKPIIYYASGLLHCLVEGKLLNEEIDSKYIKLKYHLQMIIGLLFWNDKPLPPYNSKKIDKDCESFIKEIIDPVKFSSLLEKSILTINNVISNIDDLEVNKSGSIVNEIIMYCDLGINRNDLTKINVFCSSIENYLIPFFNIQLDGDLRYNFPDRLMELKAKVKSYGLKELEIFLESYDFSDIDLRKRSIRKKYAKEIHDRVQVTKKAQEKIIVDSKKYKLNEL